MNATLKESAAQRNVQLELMDQPGILPTEHQHALRSLARINLFSRSAAMLAGPIRQLAQTAGRRPLRVLDLASGGGDITIALAKKFARHQPAITWHGYDISPVAIAHARENAQRAGVNVEFIEHNVLQAELPPDYDVVMCSLFLHHLEETDAVALLSKMRQATRGIVLVNDLRRCHTGYALAHLACRILTRSPIVHYDGPISVKNAFTIPEVQQLAERAGLINAVIRRRWPWRFLLAWSKP